MIEQIEDLKTCRLCPRACGVNRTSGQKGRCHTDAQVKIARAALHLWEEPCLSGTAGSGAVFFTGCALGCIFCQNREISDGEAGLTVSVERLAEIFLELQGQNANNINLVTAGHYVPQVCAALERAKQQGLRIPVVYNSSGYEKVETLRKLEGLVDIYLPDLKYLDGTLAAAYSHAADYPEYAMAAIAEMVRQQPQAIFVEEGIQPDSDANKEAECCVAEAQSTEERKNDAVGYGKADCIDNCTELRKNTNKESVSTETFAKDTGGIMRRGVIVRHLLLPGHVREAKRVVEYLYRTYGDQIYISMMNQYTPVRTDFADANLNRGVTKREYQRLLDFAAELGVTQGFYQEGATASESFIPAFNYEGVLTEGKEWIEDDTGRKKTN